MERYLKLLFDDIEGRNCKECMLSFQNNSNKCCVALRNYPICSENGCRKDCPLIENVKEYPILDINDERYKRVIENDYYLLKNYSRKEYRDCLKNKSISEINAIKCDIQRYINNIKILHEGLLNKLGACEDILASQDNQK